MIFIYFSQEMCREIETNSGLHTDDRSNIPNDDHGFITMDDERYANSELHTDDRFNIKDGQGQVQISNYFVA